MRMKASAVFFRGLRGSTTDAQELHSHARAELGSGLYSQHFATALALLSKFPELLSGACQGARMYACVCVCACVLAVMF